MAVQDLTLSGNLHVKPMTARIQTQLCDIKIALQEHASQTEWHGRAVIWITTGLYGVASLILLNFAELEGIVAISLGIFGSMICLIPYLDTQGLIQKHSVKLISYAWHSLGAPVHHLLKTFDTTNYAKCELTDLMIHLEAAIDAQQYVGYFLDKIKGKSSKVYEHSPPLELELLNLPGFTMQVDTYKIRLSNLIADADRIYTDEFMKRFRKDNCPFIQAAPRFLMDNIGERCLDQLISMNPQESFLFHIFRTYLLIAFHPLTLSLAFLGRPQNRLSPYQEHLSGLLKEAILRIYQDPILLQHIATTEEKAKELIKATAAEVFIQIVTFTQYLEIFTPCAGANETRQQKLTSLRGKLDKLSPVETGELLSKIFKTDGCKLNEELQPLYLELSELAQELHQGTLMTISYFNPTQLHANPLENENYAELFVNKNVFLDAYNEALKEIEKIDQQS